MASEHKLARGLVITRHPAPDSRLGARSTAKVVTAADGHIAIKATPEMTTLGARFPSTVDSLVRRIEASMYPGVRARHRGRENGDVRQYFRIRAGAPKGHHSDISNVIIQRQCRIAAVGRTSDRTLDIEPEVAPRDAVDV